LSRYFRNTLYTVWTFAMIVRVHDKKRDVTRMHPVYAKASRTWGETLIERRCLATGVLATFFPLSILSFPLSSSLPLSISIFPSRCNPFWLPFIPLLRSSDNTVSIPVKANDASATRPPSLFTYERHEFSNGINDTLIDDLDGTYNKMIDT